MNSVYIICIVHMGIEERKHREKLQKRKAILDAAMELFLEVGFEKTSMRSIAQKAEYSPGTIYLYFKDKDDLFLNLHNQAFEQMMLEVMDGENFESAFEQLKELGRRYLEFAFCNPKLYDLIFIMEAPIICIEGNEEIWEGGIMAFGMVKSILQACQTEGYFRSQNAEDLAMVVWSFMHGIVVLHAKQRMTMFQEDEEATQKRIENAFTLFMQMLSSHT